MTTKYYGIRKEKRDQSVRDYAKEYPKATQGEIARVFGVTQATISRALKGKPETQSEE